MSGIFSLEPDEFSGQAPVFGDASDELAAAIRRLQTAIDGEGRCWGDDEPGRAFEKTYQPDAERTVQNVQNLTSILRVTGALINNSANHFDHQDLGSAADCKAAAITDPESGSSIGLGDNPTPPHVAPASLGMSPLDTPDHWQQQLLSPAFGDRSAVSTRAAETYTPSTATPTGTDVPNQSTRLLGDRDPAVYDREGHEPSRQGHDDRQRPGNHNPKAISQDLRGTGRTAEPICDTTIGSDGAVGSAEQPAPSARPGTDAREAGRGRPGMRPPWQRAKSRGNDQKKDPKRPNGIVAPDQDPTSDTTAPNEFSAPVAGRTGGTPWSERNRDDSRLVTRPSA
ncbi:WXG100 family type VII secretion target [Nocardia wallacei]|uniref:WXG100 family type VII secretion target n=1 Tax=Nocardia wallacei TaxID=480035 RepID=UPI002458F6F1|nr:hypothetical protein [Nocardia wallacei]